MNRLVKNYAPHIPENEKNILLELNNREISRDRLKIIQELAEKRLIQIVNSTLYLAFQEEKVNNSSFYLNLSLISAIFKKNSGKHLISFLLLKDDELKKRALEQMLKIFFLCSMQYAAMINDRSERDNVFIEIGKQALIENDLDSAEGAAKLISDAMKSSLSILSVANCYRLEKNFIKHEELYREVIKFVNEIENIEYKINVLIKLAITSNDFFLLIKEAENNIAKIKKGNDRCNFLREIVFWYKKASNVNKGFKEKFF